MAEYCFSTKCRFVRGLCWFVLSSATLDALRECGRRRRRRQVAMILRGVRQASAPGSLRAAPTQVFGCLLNGIQCSACITEPSAHDPARHTRAEVRHDDTPGKELPTGCIQQADAQSRTRWKRPPFQVGDELVAGGEADLALLAGCLVTIGAGVVVFTTTGAGFSGHARM